MNGDDSLGMVVGFGKNQFQTDSAIEIQVFQKLMHHEGSMWGSSFKQKPPATVSIEFLALCQYPKGIDVYIRETHLEIHPV